MTLESQLKQNQDIPTIKNGSNWRPARTPDLLENLQLPRCTLILSLKLRKETVNYNIRSLLHAFLNGLKESYETLKERVRKKRRGD